jgi:transcriptional regulator with XRE-family HTH domain
MSLIAGYYVYGIKDPRNDELRYIGKTVNNIEVRLHQHLSSNQLKKDCSKNNWLKEVLAANQRPMIYVIEKCENEGELSSREQYWIRHHLHQGCKLTNIMSASLPKYNGSVYLNVRNEKGLSFIEAANKALISTRQLLEIEKGLREPDLIEFINLQTVYGVKPDAFITSEKQLDDYIFFEELSKILTDEGYIGAASVRYYIHTLSDKKIYRLVEAGFIRTKLFLGLTYEWERKELEYFNLEDVKKIAPLVNILLEKD